MRAGALTPTRKRLPLRGVEQDSKTKGFIESSGQGGAESGAESACFDVSGPQLAEVVKAWPTLPPEARQAVLALVRGDSSVEQG